VIAALALGACASVGEYAENRALDLSQVLEVHVFNGDGGGVLLEATPLLQLGAVAYDGDALGWRGRWAGTWQESTHGVGFVFGGRGTTYQGAGWLSPDHQEEVYGTLPKLTGVPDNVLHWMYLRATVGLLVGVDVQVSLGEALDFAAGIVTWDPAGDDGVSTPRDVDATASDASAVPATVDDDGTDRDVGVEGVIVVSPGS